MHDKILSISHPVDPVAYTESCNNVNQKIQILLPFRRKKKCRKDSPYCKLGLSSLGLKYASGKLILSENIYVAHK